MSRKILFILFSILSFTCYSQSKSEAINRSVFNKIEFFINTQLTDSIYNLASEAFKEKISADQLAYTLNNVYQLGRIRNVQVVDFNKNTATYKLEFDQYNIDTKFSLDSTFHFDILSFLPAEKTIDTTDKQDIKSKTSILTKVEAISPTDFYIDSIANTYINEGNAQSLTIALFHKNKYKSFLYGETEKGNGTLPSDTTLYEIGSLTKIFTAILLADLVTREVINLDDTITNFLPDSVSQNSSIQGITFKQLANHTSGLPRLASNADEVADFKINDPYAKYKRTDLFQFLKNYEMNPERSGSYEYSNLGYGLLGELVSSINKKPYIQCVQEIILTPLKMSNTTDKSVINSKHLITGHDNQGQPTNAWTFDVMVGAGGLKSTARDLMLLALEQFKMPENKFQYALALTRQFTAFTPDNTDIGLAWRMSMLDGLIYFHHSGATGGSTSFIGISPDTKSAIVVLSNSTQSVDSISKAILEKIIGDPNE